LPATFCRPRQTSTTTNGQKLSLRDGHHTSRADSRRRHDHLRALGVRHHPSFSTTPSFPVITHPLYHQRSRREQAHQSTRRATSRIFRHHRRGRHHKQPGFDQRSRDDSRQRRRHQQQRRRRCDLLHRNRLTLANDTLAQQHRPPTTAAASGRSRTWTSLDPNSKAVGGVILNQRLVHHRQHGERPVRWRRLPSERRGLLCTPVTIVTAPVRLASLAAKVTGNVCGPLDQGVGGGLYLGFGPATQGKAFLVSKDSITGNHAFKGGGGITVHDEKLGSLVQSDHRQLEHFRKQRRDPRRAVFYAWVTGNLVLQKLHHQQQYISQGRRRISRPSKCSPPSSPGCKHLRQSSHLRSVETYGRGGGMYLSRHRRQTIRIR